MTNFNFLLNNLSYLSNEDLVVRPMDSTCFRSAPVPPSFRLRLHPLRMVATLLLLLCLGVAEVWGAQVGPTTISISSGWTNKSGAGYCGGYGKNAGWYVSDYNITALSTVLSNAGNSNFSLTIRVKGLVNQGGSGGYVNSLSVVLLNSSGSTVGDPQTITNLPNGTSSSAAQWKSFSFTPTSTVTGYKIYGGKNCAVFQTEYTLTYDNAPSCDKTVTLNYDGDASGLHGSFVLKAGSASGSTIAEGGTIDNCGSGTTSVVVVPTPDTHYHVSSVSATNKTGDVSGPDGDGNYTITYTQGSNITSSITVTFEEDTKHTLTFYNNGIPTGETIEIYDGMSFWDMYEEDNTLEWPILTSSSACHATSRSFAGWTSEDIGSTSVHTIDIDLVVDPSTIIEDDLDLNALWGTIPASPTTTFAASGYSKSETAPLTKTQDNISLYLEAGSIYIGSPNTFTITSGTSHYFSVTASNKVLAKLETTCNSGTYGIRAVSDGNLSSSSTANQTTTDINTYSVWCWAKTSNQIRMQTCAVYCYDNYITTCCTPLGSINGSFLWSN